MRAVIVAAGDLDSLPAEVQTVANALSGAGWIVRLCMGREATRGELLAVAGEGDADLVWLGAHSGPGGFELADGAWPAAQAGVWLCNIGAREAVLNACFSAEHVDTIQRAAGVGVAATIDPAGVEDGLAWQTGVHLIRAYLQSGDMAQAVRQASGYGLVQYRYFPPTGAWKRRGGGMTDTQAQLEKLITAIQGDPYSNPRVPGLLERIDRVAASVDALAADVRLLRADTERRFAAIEAPKKSEISARTAYAVGGVVVMFAIILFLIILKLGGSF